MEQPSEQTLFGHETWSGQAQNHQYHDFERVKTSWHNPCPCRLVGGRGTSVLNEYEMCILPFHPVPSTAQVSNSAGYEYAGHGVLSHSFQP